MTDPCARYTSFERIVFPRDEVATWAVAPRGCVQALATSPDGRHLVVEYANSVVVLEPYGVHQHVGPELGRWCTQAGAEGLAYGDELHDWEGTLIEELGPLELFGEASNPCQHVAELTRERWLTVVGHKPARDVAQTWIASQGRGSDTSDALNWLRKVDGEAIAALAPGGDLAVVNATQFQLYPAQGGGGHTTSEHPAQDQACPVHQIYLVAPHPWGWSTVAALNHGPADVGTRRRTDGRLDSGQRWRSRIQCYSTQGTLGPSCTLAHEVLQPPLSLGDDRLVLAGRGLTCMRAGEIEWAWTSQHTTYATVLAQGYLMVATGHTLRFLDCHGRAMLTLETPDRETIVTRPIAGPEGTVHLATDNKIYALRPGAPEHSRHR